MNRFLYPALCVSCLLLCVPNALIAAENAVHGSVEISGFCDSNKAGLLILSGTLFNCDCVMVSELETGDFLASFGPIAPPENQWKHLFCPLSDFVVEIEGLGNIHVFGLFIETMSIGREGVQYSELGRWLWSAPDEFVFDLYFPQRTTGCFTDGICGANRIFGPYCDPCRYTLCCYEDYGYITCGLKLCH